MSTSNAVQASMILPTLSTMSNKRYFQIQETIKSKLDEELIKFVMETISDVMKFQPSQPKKDEVLCKRYGKIKEKCKEIGVSTYQFQNQKKYYEAHKVELNQKKTQARRLKKATTAFSENS